MKANEAPEKIYRRREGKYIIYYNYKPAKISYNEKEPTEYTRTDAFIKKTIGWLKEQDEMIGVSFQDDFLKRFQNYMKGE